MSTLSPAYARAYDSVMKATIGNITEGTPEIRGYDFNHGINYEELIKSYRFSGFQATNLGIAIEEISQMLENRDKPIPADHIAPEIAADPYTAKTNCTVFLGYTSNMISSGMREHIRFLVQHNMVDCIVTSAGGVEEDIIKCLSPTYLGDFYLDDKELRESGINRIGNLLVPNENYCKFETWITPILDDLLEKQEKENVSWTPSTFVEELGKRLDNHESVLFWAAKNKIPIFCPALTDGSLGDMMYFHTIKNGRGLKIDIVHDVFKINTMAVKASNTGVIILGGGIVKHHICNANLMRNGADYAVFINTGQEYDGSDAGARPQEAISWGKIKKNSNPIKVYSDATLVFPLLVAETFAKHHFKNDKCPF